MEIRGIIASFLAQYLFNTLLDCFEYKLHFFMENSIFPSQRALQQASKALWKINTIG